MDPFVPLLLLLSIVVSFIPTSSAVQCYMCSWSPRDNRTDVCSGKLFQPALAYKHDCEHGCEIYVQWDKNEDLEHWRRNCIQDQTKITGDCIIDEDRARRWRQCTCQTDLCNSAMSWTSTKSLLTAVFSVMLSLALSY